MSYTHSLMRSSLLFLLALTVGMWSPLRGQEGGTPNPSTITRPVGEEVLKKYVVTYCQNISKICRTCETGTSSTPLDTSHQYEQCYIIPGQSSIDPYSINLLHDVSEWKLSHSSGCGPCGGRSASGIFSTGALPGLDLTRTHRFRDMSQRSSFGPGVYQTYDVTLNLALRNDGTWLVTVTDPSLLAPVLLTDSGGGLFKGAGWNVIQGMRFYTGTAGTGTAVANPSQAASGVLTAFNGSRYVFDLIDPLGSVPAPWVRADIGNVGSWGSVAASGTDGFTLSASGNDIWGTADAFGYLHQAIQGDTTIIAQVKSIAAYRGLTADSTNAWVKSGLMIRETLEANAPFVDVFATKANANGINFQSRMTPGANAVNDKQMPAPEWVRLTRSGDTFTSELSVDGVTWTAAGTQTISMPATVYAGLAVSANNNAALCTASFAELSMPAGTSGTWTDLDLGSVGLPGSSSITGTSAAVSGSGASFWGGTDSGHFTYQTLTGDGTITTRIGALDNTNSLARAGLMIRSSLAANATYAASLRLPGGATGLHYRATTGGTTASTTQAAQGGVPVWLKLQRQGDVMTGFVSPDGVTWTTVTSKTVPMAQTVYVGLQTCSHDANVLADTAFDHVSITGTAVPPAQWPVPTTAPTYGSSRAGRLVQILDRNGQGIQLAYRTWTAAELLESPDRAWQLDTITDAYGKQLVFHYGSQQVSGRWAVSSIDLPNGSSIAYSYTKGLLSSVTYPTGDVSTFTYTPNANTNCTVVGYQDAGADGTHRRKETYLTNLFGSTSNKGPYYIYDQASNLVRMVVNGAGEVSYLNTFSSSLKVNHYLGGGTLRAINKVGASTVVGNYATWAINADYTITGTMETQTESIAYADDNKFRQGTPNQHIDSQGLKTTFLADADGFVYRATAPDGTTTTSTFNSFKQVTNVVDRLGRATTLAYDANGNLLSKTVGAGSPTPSTWSWTYNSLGQVLSATDANGNVTSYFYGDTPGANDYRRLIAIVEPRDRSGDAQATSTFIYDSAGRLATATDASGRVVTHTYDARNRLVQTLYADASTETVTYGTGINANLVVAQTDRNGNRTTFTYDTHGRRTSQTQSDPTGLIIVATQSWTYLHGTHRVATTVRDGDSTETTFDYALRPVTSTSHPNATTALTTATAYDTRNRRASTTDAYGRRSFPVYDLNNRVIRTVQELTSGGYTGATDQTTLATLVRPSGLNPAYRIEDSTYDAEGQIMTRTDGRGTVHSTTYDPQGRLTTQIEADRIPSGSTTIPAPDGALTQFAYDAQGNRTGVIAPRSFQRQASGIFVAGTAGEFRTTTTYTGRNLVASVIVADGLNQVGGVRPERAVTTMTYSPTGKVLTTTDPRGFVTTNAYGTCCDRLTAVTDATGAVTQYTYDRVGNVLTVLDPNGVVTTTTYDARHRTASMTNGAGETTTYTYDNHGADGAGLSGTYAAVFAGLGLGAGADGSAIAVTNALGQTTIQVNDGLGRRVASRDGNGNVSRASYDGLAGGLVVTSTSDALNNTTSAAVDAMGRARVHTDAAGAQTLASFDANGNQVSIRDPNGVGMDCVYDVRNRDRVCTDTAGAVTRKDFDEHNNVVKSTDALNQETLCTFDGNDRKVSCRDRITAVTGFSFDRSGNLERITDAEGGATEYTYDGRNLLLTETYPTGQQGPTKRAYTYDAGRRLTSRTVTIAGQSGPSAFVEVTQYQYDAANRLIHRVYPADGRNDDFGYDDASRLLSARSNRYGNTIARAYDAGGRLTSETMTIDAGTLVAGAVVPFSATVGYSYDAANRTQTITYPDGSLATRTYTPRHLLETVGYAGSPIATRQYDTGGRLATTTLGNGKVETRQYRVGDNLIATMAVPGVTDFGYLYDDNKRKTAEVDLLTTANNQGFGYDHENRLTTWNRGTTLETQSFALTAVGDFSTVTRNGVTETRTHSAVHEATSITSPTTGLLPLSYDTKGNLTTDDHGTALAWDPENRLRRARIKAGTALSWSGAIAAYAYDALGRRVEKTIGQRTTRFLHDGAQVIQEVDQASVAASAAEVASDGSAANADETPASGGILQGTGIKRVNMQPATSVIPVGYYADKGRILGARTNGLTYGWEADASADTVARGSAVPLAEFDTFLAMQPSAGITHTWTIALPDGSYPVIVVAGDAISANQTNHLQIGDQAVTDSTPAVATPGYQRGNFDGYAVQVTVSGGQFQIAPRTGAFNAKLCFLEIGPAGSTIDQETRDRLQNLIDSMNAATWEDTPPAVDVRGYVYLSYVDEPAATITTAGRFFYHSNHLYSVAALTDNAGAVVERYRYSSHGERTVLAPDGVTTRTASLYGNQVGFTGRYQDKESGLWYFRNRMLSSSIGQFIGRNQFGSPVGWKYTVSQNDHLNVRLVNLSSAYSASAYIEGMSLYLSNLGLRQTVDPSGEPPPGYIPTPNGGGWNTVTGEYTPPPPPTPPSDTDDGSVGNTFGDAKRQAKGNDTSPIGDSLHHCIAVCLFGKRMWGGGGVGATVLGLGAEIVGNFGDLTPGLSSTDWDSDIVSNRNGKDCAASTTTSCKCCCMLKQGNVP